MINLKDSVEYRKERSDFRDGGTGRRGEGEKGRRGPDLKFEI